MHICVTSHCGVCPSLQYLGAILGFVVYADHATVFKVIGDLITDIFILGLTSFVELCI